jgi:pyruvate/oxaloacetate carboxyltransferase
MKMEHIASVAEELDKVGYYSLEDWGAPRSMLPCASQRGSVGAPAQRLRGAIKNTRLQMLLRGQNVLGYRHYADDIVEKSSIKAKENGMDIFRIFDALNDLRNMQWAMEVTKRVGGHVQGTICYTRSPIHTLEAFVDMGKSLRDMRAPTPSASRIWPGLIDPYEAYDLTKRLKSEFGLPVVLHCHYTSGMASMAYLKAAEAGIDAVYCAISTVAGGTSQPPTESIVARCAAPRATPGLNLETLADLAKYFARCARSTRSSEAACRASTPTYCSTRYPGGMISNLLSQLREARRRRQAARRAGRGAARAQGYVAIRPGCALQPERRHPAVLNVLSGERYKMVPNDVRAYFRGMYGKAPGPVDQEIQKKNIGDEVPTRAARPILIEPELGEGGRRVEALRAERRGRALSTPSSRMVRSSSSSRRAARSRTSRQSSIRRSRPPSPRR